MKFRKKPVVIEAIQLTNDPAQAAELATWCDGMALASPERVSLHIETLEGTMVAHPGDWIIKGVQNEFYPCKNDIFQETYEPVEDQ